MTKTLLVLFAVIALIKANDITCKMEMMLVEKLFYDGSNGMKSMQIDVITSNYKSVVKMVQAMKNSCKSAKSQALKDCAEKANSVFLPVFQEYIAEVERNPTNFEFIYYGMVGPAGKYHEVRKICLPALGLSE